MADHKGPGAADAQPTMAEYKKSQARVRELVEKRRLLERRLAQVEDSIATKETMYLEGTPNGNIITGFDNYMKGTTGAAAQRRKTGHSDQNRVFSRSSISYRPNNGESGASGGSTPGSHAPTPLSTNFKDTGSANATPTSATAGKNASKLKKKDNEDSEAESQTNKKRTNFGASRK
ncbi:Chromatin modification-related protein eaf6 [Paramyrothecium foliicola]|nr:Chromatin modification-related protein eaf6 [Paramyrothecium foliicola]